MTVTFTTRLGLPQWGAGSDPFTRAQMNAAFTALETNAAGALQGVIGSRPAAGSQRRFYYGTDNGGLSYDTGSVWVQIPTLGVAATFTAKQTISLDASPQEQIETATATGTAQLFLKRRTASDGSTYSGFYAEADQLGGRLLAKMSSYSGASDLSGNNGHWALNWNNANSAIPELFVLKDTSGNERFRFTEGGLLGIGIVPTRALDVQIGSGSNTMARFGATDEPYALTMTPLGSAGILLLSGAEQSAGTATARQTTAAGVAFNAGYAQFYGNTGLTSASTFTKTLQAQISPLGVFSAFGTGVFGPGVFGDTSSPYVSLGTQGANTILKAVAGSNPADLLLTGSGSSAAIRIYPEGSSAASLVTYLAADNSDPILATPGYMQAGAIVGSAFPAFKLEQQVNNADTGGSHTCTFFTGVNNLPNRILLIQAFGLSQAGPFAQLPIQTINPDGGVIVAGCQTGAPCGLTVVYGR